MSEDIRGKIRDIRDGAPTPKEALRELARAKAKEVTKAWENHPAKNLDGEVVITTRAGNAKIGAIRFFEDADRLDGVEVWLGPQQGAPAYRLINPPLLVPDPQGDVLLSENDPIRGKTLVRRYRVDPIAAIGDFIASHQGRGEQG